MHGSSGVRGSIENSARQRMGFLFDTMVCISASQASGSPVKALEISEDLGKYTSCNVSQA